MSLQTHYSKLTVTIPFAKQLKYYSHSEPKRNLADPFTLWITISIIMMVLFFAIPVGIQFLRRYQMRQQAQQVNQSAATAVAVNSAPITQPQPMMMVGKLIFCLINYS